MSTEAKPTYALVCESGWPHAIFNSLGVAEIEATKRSVAPEDVNPSAGLHVYSVVRYVPDVEQACAVPADPPEPTGGGEAGRLPTNARERMIAREPPDAIRGRNPVRGAPDLTR